MIYLDTHVVVWLYAGLLEKISNQAREYIEENDLIISPMVELELTYLKESQKISVTSQIILTELASKINLKICDIDFASVAEKAIKLTWTRDPFNRLIVANAQCQSSKLITKDNTILKHYRLAVW